MGILYMSAEDIVKYMLSYVFDVNEDMVTYIDNKYGIDWVEFLDKIGEYEHNGFLSSKQAIQQGFLYLGQINLRRPGLAALKDVIENDIFLFEYREDIQYYTNLEKQNAETRSKYEDYEFIDYLTKDEAEYVLRKWSGTGLFDDFKALDYYNEKYNS